MEEQHILSTWISISCLKSLLVTINGILPLLIPSKSLILLLTTIILLQSFYILDNVFHGLSAVFSKDELQALKRSPGFVSAYKDVPVELHTTHAPEFLKLNPSFGLWPASNFGQDVIIGVVDTGIWPESLSFRDDGMPEIPKRWKGICRTGTDFNSSLSSLAAGNYVHGVSYFGYATGTAKGVAPRARLAIYKISWPEFSTSTADVIAGMDQAVADGVDIISISSGFRHIPLYEDSIAIGTFGAMMKGILVSASAGNSGPDFGTLGNGDAWIMTIAPGTTDRTFAGTLTLANGQKMRGWSLFPLSALVKDSTVIYNKTLSSCNSIELLSQVHSPNIPNYEVIVCDGSDGLLSQMRTVMEVRFRVGIFISSDPRALTSKNFPTPGIVIGPKEGKQVINYVPKTEHPSVSIRFQETYVDVKPAPKLAPSRSYLGITKPDLMSDYILQSGTSMACLHASGIAAMLKSVHPEWSPSAIKSVMMTTANPLDNTRDQIIASDTSEPATPLDMGAGFIDPN
ncbi:hypothetical protein P3L10_002364 [Capsicum annuum]